MAAAKRKKTIGTLGEKTKTRMMIARAKYTPASAIFMRRIWMYLPIHRLPNMLKSPMMESDHAETLAGSWQNATMPGRCVAMKAMWKPQVKNPAVSRR